MEEYAMEPQGQIQYFRSAIDDTLAPCAVCATDTDGEPKPLIVEASPGAWDNLPGCATKVEEIARIALKHGKSCVALRPTGRGNGSVYQNYGEIDVFEAIEHVKRNYPIDESRISVTGGSMGGAATWYLTSHYPDVFSAAAPFCGYCDYRLWEKPGGFTYQMHDWEEPSWMARSAAFLVENLRHTAFWIVHGEWDRAVGGGVSVEHSRRMASLFTEQGYTFKYTEVPEAGHSCMLPEIYDEVVPWLLEQERAPTPERVAHSTYTLRHNRSHWLTIETLGRYGEKATLDARKSGKSFEISSRNVEAFSIAPAGSTESLQIVVDGKEFADIHLIRQETFCKDSQGRWRNQAPNLRAGKRHGVSGPIGDMFFERVVLIPGTFGSAHAIHANRNLAKFASNFYSYRNGGVHRGGIVGDNKVKLPVIDDGDLTESERRQHNLILYGTPSSNRVLAHYEDRLPLSFSGNTIRIHGREFTSDACAAFAVFPHPENPERYVAIHGGTTPDAICWGSHLHMNLLPDYIVYAKDRVLDWGFWNGEWKE